MKHLNDELVDEFKNEMRLELDIREKEPFTNNVNRLMKMMSQVEDKSEGFLSGIESGIRMWYNFNDGRNVPDLTEFVWQYINNKDIDPIYFKRLFAIAVDINIEFFMKKLKQTVY